MLNPAILNQDIPDQIDQEEPNWSLYLIHKAAWIAPILNSINQMNQASMALLKIFEKRGWPIYVRIPCAAVAFITSLTMNGRFAVNGIHETINLIRHREIPDYWKMPTRLKQYFLFIVPAIMATYVMFADSIQSYFYTDALPGEYKFSQHISLKAWTIAAIVMAVAIGITTVFSEGLEIFKACQELFHSDTVHYRNKWIKHFSRLAGGIPGFFGAFNDAMGSFVGMVNVFKVKSLFLSITIGLLSSFIFVADFSLSGRFNIKNINQVLESFYEQRPNAKQIIALLVTLIPASFMGFVFHELSLSFLESMTKHWSLPRNIVVETLIQTISLGTALNETFSDLGALFGFSYYFVSNLSEKLQYLIDSCQAKLANDMPKERTPLLANRIDPILTEIVIEQTLQQEQNFTRVDPLITLTIEPTSPTTIVTKEISDQKQEKESVASIQNPKNYYSKACPFLLFNRCQPSDSEKTFKFRCNII